MKESINIVFLKYQMLKKSYAFWILFGLLLISSFSRFIANDKPIIKIGAFEVSAPIHFSPSKTNLKNTFLNPLSRDSENGKIHFLGTDKLGRDVAAGIIHGTRIAMIIGITSMLMAGIIGIILGLLSGYFGNTKFKLSIISVVIIIFGIIGVIFHLTYHKFYISDIFIFAIIISSFIAIKKIEKKDLKKVNIPIDSIINRLIEIIRSIPGLLLILAIVSIVEKPSIWNIILIIGLFGWTSIARYTRAETLKIKEKAYIKTIENQKLPISRILFIHTLPNVIGPAIISIIFGIAGAITLEASISFLGLGLGLETITWGSLLNEARSNFSAWWLAVFPGMMIFITLISLNSLGKKLS